jgi:flavin reductase (DIM6/NTAB) family NADH-FMN oxidoreductase RutF
VDFPIKNGDSYVKLPEGTNIEATGSVRSACAYLECKIVSRMDAADHWVGYAEVLGGDVARSSATAAVHHRKVGTYY